MLFNSYIFIFCFLPAVLIGFIFFRNKFPKLAIFWLILSSIFYYSWWKPYFLLILFFSIMVNLIFAKIILNKSLSPQLAKTMLSLGVIFNLAVLAYFKYLGFFIANINQLFSIGLPSLDILLPLGISFITFQKIAFLVDAYRGQVNDFTITNYIFFVTFFPQLIAGPIVHHAEIMPQVKNIALRDFKTDLAVGISIFIVGLFKKVILADSFAVYADAGFDMIKEGHPIDFISAWMTVLCYTFQLYYDFSGYSDMAIGLARMFGISLPINFNSPYKATSIIDFWRRWHMTLSRFLRDYLYFPLGGNKKGRMRRYINLMIVMLLGGLWHGANWTFAIWGGIHGIYLIINHGWRKLSFYNNGLFHTIPLRMMATGITFTLVTIAWIPFRADTPQHAYTMFFSLFPTKISPAMLSFKNFIFAQFHHFFKLTEWLKPRELWPSSLPPDYLATMTKPAGVFLLIMIVFTFFMPNTAQIFSKFHSTVNDTIRSNSRYSALSCLDVRIACLIAGMFVMTILKLSHVSPFLYFQF